VSEILVEHGALVRGMMERGEWDGATKREEATRHRPPAA
jgi:hypothetical protein